MNDCFSVVIVFKFNVMNKTILIHTLGVDLPKTEFRGIYLTQVVLCFKGRKKGKKAYKKPSSQFD